MDMGIHYVLSTDLLFGLLRCFQLTHEIALYFNLFQNLFTRITHILNANTNE